MKKEKQRIKIAEACGWKLNPDWQRPGIGKWWEHPDSIGNPKRFNNLPDYLNDLNAMHEAEEVLTDAQLEDYAYWLMTMRDPIHATASQRAEAFLRTLGLWEEGG